MSRLRKLAVFSVLLLISALPQASPTAAPKQSVSTAHDLAQARTASFPPLWFSQTTHTTYRVRIDGNILRAEQTNIPLGAAKRGAYVRTEARKTGNKWVGESKVYAQITVKAAGKPQQSNWCHLEANIEFLTLTPDRITGRSEAPLQMDILKCQVLKKEWKDFVWVPAK